jgi:hypothetical protein
MRFLIEQPRKFGPGLPEEGEITELGCLQIENDDGDPFLLLIATPQEDGSLFIQIEPGGDEEGRTELEDLDNTDGIVFKVTPYQAFDTSGLD